MNRREEGGALIWCAFPDEVAARATVARLLDSRLVACGNILPGMASLFAWRGERGESAECGVLLKTTARHLDKAMAELRALHPYEAPSIAGWTVHVDDGTLHWLKGETSPA